MHQQGHVGSSLLALAPLAATLTYFEQFTAIFALTLVGLSKLTMLPDKDMEIPFLTHRGITHTVWFAVLIGGIGAGAGYLYAYLLSFVKVQYIPSPNPLVYVAIGFAAGCLLILGHVLGDVVTVTGVEILHPYSEKTYRIEALTLPTTADSSVANFMFLLLGVFAYFGGIVLVGYSEGLLPLAI